MFESCQHRKATKGEGETNFDNLSGFFVLKSANRTEKSLTQLVGDGSQKLDDWNSAPSLKEKNTLSYANFHRSNIKNATITMT